MEAVPVLIAEYAVLSNTETGQTSLSFAAQQATNNLGPGGNARVNCITACTSPVSSTNDSACLYLHDTLGHCQLLPLPENSKACSSHQAPYTHPPMARLRGQHCSPVWVSSNGRFALLETGTADGPALCLRDLSSRRETVLSRQALHQDSLVQAWVSDTGKALLVQSSVKGQERFCLWCRREGSPDSPLPKQPVDTWRHLPDVPSKTNQASAASPPIGNGSAGRNLSRRPAAAQLDESMPDISPAGSEDVTDEAAAGARQSPAITVAAGFAHTFSGLCICIAVADCCGLESAELCVHTLIEPVWSGAADAKVWQQTVLPLTGSSSTGDGAAPIAGHTFGAPLQTVGSFEEIDLHQADALERRGSGIPGQNRPICAIMRWQPEGRKDSSAVRLATVLSCGPRKTWLAMFKALAVTPATVCHKVVLQPSSLRGGKCAEPAARSPRNYQIAGLTWLQDGRAVVVMDQHGRLAFFDTEGRPIPVTVPGHRLQAGSQHTAVKVLHETLWRPGMSPGQARSTCFAMCTYTSSESPAAARLAVLHGSQLIILSVRSVPDLAGFSLSSPGPMLPGLNGASSADRTEFADIAPAVELSRAAPAPAIKPKHGRMRTLRVLVACVGPHEVSLDDTRPADAQARFQHSLPETSPGKSPAGSGPVSPFRVPGAMRARLSSTLRHSGSPHPGSPTQPHRSPEMGRTEASQTPRAPVPSPDSDERATNGLQPSSAVEGGRRVNFSGIYETIKPGQDRGPQYPGNPDLEAISKAARLGSAGSSGSPRMLHAPKKSILRPLGSKANCPSLEPSPEPPKACAEESLVLPNVNDKTQQAAAAGQVRRNTEPGMAVHASSRSAAESQERQARGRAMTGLPRLNMSAHDISGESGDAASRSPTALQVKLHRLRARWSTLADRSHALSRSGSKAATSAKNAKGTSETDSFAVSVTAAAPFTIIELQDGEEALDSEAAPESADMGSRVSPAWPAASAGRAADAPAEAVNIKAADVSAHDIKLPLEHLDDMPGMSAWEELGLPPGVTLWGPTVLELPNSPLALSQSKAISPELTLATAQTGAVTVRLTPPRPVAEAVESEASPEVSQLSSGSLHLSSTSSSSRSSTGHYPTGSATATESAMQFQGNGLFERLASGLTSPSLTDTTLLLSAARSDAAESKRPVGCGAQADVPNDAARLNFADDRSLSSDTSAPSQQVQEGLTLDQTLSAVWHGPEDAAQLPSNASPNAADQSAILPAAVAMDAVTHSRGEAATKASEEENIGPGTAEGVTIVQVCGPETSQPKGSSGGLEEFRSAVDGIHMGNGDFCEPAVLDRGEPTFEDSMRYQQQAPGTGWRAGQLLLLRKQAPPRAQPGGASSPQRSCSPFGRLAYPRRARSDLEPAQPMIQASWTAEQARHTTEDMAASGPGPLEKGVHEAEIGGYYLTTPDPLRTDTGLALRIQRSASEQSAHSAAQRRAHGSDPLNCDMVQYVSSPAWRMNTLTALDMLRSGGEAASAFNSHPGRQTAAKTTQSARGAWRSDTPDINTWRSSEGMPPAPSIQHSGGKLHSRLSSGARELARALGSAEQGRHCAEDSRCSANEAAAQCERKLQKHKRSRKSLYSSSRHRAPSANGDRKARDVHGTRRPSAPRDATSSDEASATERNLIKAIRCGSDARLLRPKFAPAAEDNSFALPCSDGLRLVDTDCKWGLNRAGRPPDAFWEHCALNRVRKISAADNRIRLLRVELNAEQPQRGLLRKAGKARRSGSPGAFLRPERPRRADAEDCRSESRVMKELQEIAAALREIKATAATRSAKPEALPDSSEQHSGHVAGEKPVHQQKATGSGAALLRLARRQRSPKSQSPSNSKRASESGTGDARDLAQQGRELSAENAAPEQTGVNSSSQACIASAKAPAEQARRDTGQDGQGLKAPGQKELPAAPNRAAVDSGVQATPVACRVPVQAVLLSPASLLQQNVESPLEEDIRTPTTQELEALRQLRAGLDNAAGRPLRAFTHVRDVHVGDSRDTATNSLAADPSRHEAPGRKRLIHPSSPVAASWGSRHAQHIGNRPGSAATPKAAHAMQRSKEAKDKELKAMAAQVTKLMASLQDIEALAMALKSDAAASCQMVKKLQARPRATVGATA